MFFKANDIQDNRHYAGSEASSMKLTILSLHNLMMT